MLVRSVWRDQHHRKLVHMLIYMLTHLRQAELVHLRHECAEGRAFRQVCEAENKELLMKLHSTQLKLHSAGGSPHVQDSEKIRERLVSEHLMGWT